MQILLAIQRTKDWTEV